VRDLERELLNLQQSISDEFSVEISGLNTCNFFSGFQEDLTNLARLSNRNNYQNKFAVRIDCAFDDSGINAQAFYNDFNQGGWDALKTTFMRPESATPFGAYLETQDELARRQADEEQRELEELAWGRGLRPLKDAATGLITTPASVIEAQLNEVLSSQLRGLENADELSEMVVAAVSNLITSQVMNSGVFDF